MSRFDENILQEILTRLPAKTLIQLKCTCKRWNHLISSAFFIKTQAIRSTNYVHGFLTTPAYRSGVLAYSPIDRGIGPGEYPNITLGMISLHAACNGLIFFEANGIYKIGNPSTNSFYQVPPVKDAAITQFGIAFDPSMPPTSVKIVGCNWNRFLVYFPQANKWRVSRRLYNRVNCFVGDVNSVFLNGALHWLQIKGGIVAFNVEKEKPYRIKLPVGVNPKVIYGYSDTWLGVVKGRMTLVRFNGGIHVWEMKDYQSRIWEFKKHIATCNGAEGHYEDNAPLFYDGKKCVLLTWGRFKHRECGLAVYRIGVKRWDQIHRLQRWMDTRGDFVPHISHLWG